MVDTERSSATGISCRNPSSFYAQVVKLVDTLASGASALMGVEVQVLFWAPFLK